MPTPGPTSPEARAAEPAWERWLTPVLTLAVVGYALVGAAPKLTTHFLGIQEVDHYGTQWFYWLVEHTLFHAEGLGDLGHTDLFFHPWGKDIYAHTGSNVLDALAALPFRLLFGPVLGFNLFVLAGMLFNGWAFHRLAREFSTDRLALGAGTLFFATSPYLLYEFVEGRPTQGIVGLVALFLLQLWRAGRSPGWRAPVIGGLLLAVLGYQYWFYAFFGGMAALGHGLFLVARPTAGQARSALLGRHALIAAVAVGLCLPVAGGLMAGAASGEVPGLLDASGWSSSSVAPVTREGTDIALLVWQPLSRQSGFVMADGPGTVFVGHQRILAWPAIVVLVAWLVRPGRLERGPVLAMGALCGVVALGPVLVYGSRWVLNPVYVALVRAVPFLQRLWWPGRAYVVIAVVVGLAAVVVLAGVRDRRFKALLATALVGGAVADLHGSRLLPLPAWDGAVPAGYQCLEHGEPGAIVELPIGWNQAHLYYQTVHERPIMGGMLENNLVLSPPELVQLRRDNTLLASLIQATQGAPSSGQPAEGDKEQLYELGYRYVVLQKDAMRLPPGADPTAERVQRTASRRLASTMEQQLGRPVYDDARVAIYAPWGDPSPCPDQVEDTQPGPVLEPNPTGSVMALPEIRLQTP